MENMTVSSPALPIRYIYPPQVIVKFICCKRGCKDSSGFIITCFPETSEETLEMRGSKRVLFQYCTAWFSSMPVPFPAAAPIHT